jgi:hypothetical protein
MQRVLEPTRASLDELWLEEILFARRYPAVQRMIAAGELFDEMCERMRAGIRHEFPEADERRVNRILFERMELARRLEEAS